MIKIGLFGGAFDPIHNGHISAAELTFRELKLNKMIIMPTGISPHKSGKHPKVSFTHRLNMCKIAFGKMENFEVSDFEGKTGGKSFTLNTLRALKKTYPEDAQFFLIIGGDMLFNLPQWYKYESILKECKVTAVAREENQYINMLEFAAEIGRVKVLNLPVTDVSSTDIRKKIAEKTDISELTPKEVAEYIEKNNLYKQDLEL